MISDYGPVDSFIAEEDVVGGLDDRTIRLRAVIKLMDLLTRLGLKSPNDFINTPMFGPRIVSNRPVPNSFQDTDGLIKETIYGM
jgi:hypothetical protein